jgi:putative membrane protein
MFVNYRGSVFGIIAWQWKYMVFFTVAAAIVVGADIAAVTFAPEYREMLRLPALPLGVVGGAIGIFTSFRTNSAYDRWWEGRKLWGRLINTSRHFTSQVLVYLRHESGEITELQTRLVRRHVAYVHVLRCLLREQNPQQDKEVAEFLDTGELEGLRGSSNATHALLFAQMKELQKEVDERRLDLFHQQLLDQSLRELLDIQGGCERIKKTPFPRGYGYIAERLILAFSVLFPLGIVADMSWLAIPMSVLVCTAFLLISEVGRVLEDPFTMFWPALPLTALSRTIEINLRERLGETKLPPMPVPDAKGILM